VGTPRGENYFLGGKKSQHTGGEKRSEKQWRWKIKFNPAGEKGKLGKKKTEGWSEGKPSLHAKRWARLGGEKSGKNERKRGDALFQNCEVQNVDGREEGGKVNGKQRYGV